MKSITEAVIRECENPDCRFRFPDIDNINKTIYCPKCNSLTIIKRRLDLSVDFRTKKTHNPNVKVISILDNIRSVYNVGSIFRTAAGFGLDKIILCGITPSPDHKNFIKTSMGAENLIKWEYSLNCVDTCNQLITLGYKILSIENSLNSVELANFNGKDYLDKKFAIVLGNELIGVDPEIISLSDKVISIPILGKNKSFNVSTVYGVIAYFLFDLFNN